MPDTPDLPPAPRSARRAPRRAAGPSDVAIASGWAGTAIAAVVAVWVLIVTAGDPSAEAAAMRTIERPGAGAGDGTDVVGDVPTTLAAIEVEVSGVDESARPIGDVLDASELAALDVRVVGDSLALSAVDELRESFGSQVRVNAEVGRALNQSMTAITEATFGGPDVVVIALGTNDWDGPADYGDRIDNALSRLEGVECVVWVNTQVFRPGLENVNTDIDLGAERHGYHVARWSDLAGPVDLHIEDGYHLSLSGQALFADLIAATVASSC